MAKFWERKTMENKFKIIIAGLIVGNLIELYLCYKITHPELAVRRSDDNIRLYTIKAPQPLYEGNLDYGWYDESGEWVWKTELGFYDENNNWRWKSGLGAFDKHGEWKWFKNLGYYNDKGEWVWTLYLYPSDMPDIKDDRR